MNRKLLLAVLSLAMCLPAFASLSMRNPWKDGMVLQQQTSASIKGYAAAGAKVSVKPSWDETVYRTVADASGMWSVNVDTPAGSYDKYQIEVKSGKEEIVIRDVLVGEVWLSSGQSNMEMPVAGWGVINDAMEVITGPAMPDRIRVFMGEKCQSFEPQTYTEGYWCHANAAEIAPMSAVSYFFARKLNDVLDVPVGVICEAYGGTRVEAWLPEEILARYEEIPSRAEIEAMNDMGRPFMNYNAMLSPCIGYTIKGFIWYQGCSNVGQDGELYLKLFTEMVNRWRNDWGDTDCNLPFYTVQLAPYTYGDEWQNSRSMDIRCAQQKAAKTIRNSAMVCITDTVGEECRYDIHPRNKKPVGDRLAYLALNRQYGFRNIQCNYAEAVAIQSPGDHQIEVLIDNADNGLTNLDRIQGLEVAGEDGVFHPVSAATFNVWESRWLRVWSDEVERPVTLRYCWGDFAPGNLRTIFGQPLAPFCLTVSD